MNYLVSIILLFGIIGCINSKPNPKINWNKLESVLTGNAIDKQVYEIEKICSQTYLSSKAFDKRKSKSSKELDLYLYPKVDSGYYQLLQFYNNKFNTTHSDTVFNTWQTDSTEFILYKNSDSSILVNILKRT